MRWLVFVGILALLVGSGDRLQNGFESWIGEESDPRVEAAIELRCANDPAPLRDDCARELERDFATNVREPEEIVRRHCTRFTSEWTLEVDEPSTICTELYGGWIQG
jgi:hypothetical protein